MGRIRPHEDVLSLRAGLSLMEISGEKIAEIISTATALPFSINSIRTVGGGCINSAYLLEGRDTRYFLKLNHAEGLEMFSAEAEGLGEMEASGAIRVPHPVCHGVVDGKAYLIMEHVTFGSARGDSSRCLGRQLAAMHRCSRKQFGWHRDNTIGSTPQPNAYTENWIDFYRDRRLLFQVELAVRRGAGNALERKADQLAASLEQFFGDYRPMASLLHGDLWSGNYALDTSGAPVLFDPAVYFGDREADLAMTELFGGFSSDFYAAYREAWPLDAGYERRKGLYNLYHILNHYNLFGGGYLSQAEGVMERLLAEI